MKPLYHPSINDITVEGILYALSDPLRVHIFSEIAQCDGFKNCANFRVANQCNIPKSTLSQHFKVLRETGLIRSERKGVELHNTTRCLEIKERFGPMVSAIVTAYEQQKTRAKPKRRSATPAA